MWESSVRNSGWNFASEKYIQALGKVLNLYLCVHSSFADRNASNISVVRIMPTSIRTGLKNVNLHFN